METEFASWLQGELDKRGWDQAELAKRGRITPAQISRVLSGTRGYGLDFLRGVSRAFGLSMEEVLRKAGVLEPYVELPDSAKNWGKRLRALPEESREEAVAAMSMVLRAIENAGDVRSRR